MRSTHMLHACPAHRLPSCPPTRPPTRRLDEVGADGHLDGHPLVSQVHLLVPPLSLQWAEAAAEMAGKPAQPHDRHARWAARTGARAPEGADTLAVCAVELRSSWPWLLDSLSTPWHPAGPPARLPATGLVLQLAAARRP